MPTQKPEISANWFLNQTNYRIVEHNNQQTRRLSRTVRTRELAEASRG